MNVTDLRTKLRRSPVSQLKGNSEADRRKTSDRRVLPAEPCPTEDESRRIWLTPGERTLIEDLYLLEDK